MTDPINALFYLIAMLQAASMVKPLAVEGPHSLTEMAAEVKAAAESQPEAEPG